MGLSILVLMDPWPIPGIGRTWFECKSLTEQAHRILTVSFRLILGTPRVQPHIQESRFIFTDDVDAVVYPLHRMNVGVSSVVIVSTSLGDDIVDDSAMPFVVLLGVQALVLSM